MSSSWTVSAISQGIAFSEILSLPKPVTTSYGLNSFSYTAAKFWNALPDWKPFRLCMTLFFDTD